MMQTLNSESQKPKNPNFLQRYLIKKYPIQILLPKLEIFNRLLNLVVIQKVPKINHSVSPYVPKSY